MKRDPLNVILIVLVALLVIVAVIAAWTTPSASPQPTPTITDQTRLLVSTAKPVITPTAYTGNLVRLAWFYKPPEEGQLDRVAQDFDLFILTHKDETQMNELRTGGVQTPISQYLLFLIIEEPDDCEEEPSGNQVAYKAGDFCMISEQHPDWFLLDKSGDRIKSGKDTYHMDPGNAGYRAFWLERARELQETYGWDAIFLDNVEASLTKMTNDGDSVAQYPDDASYQKAVEGFLDYIRSNYFGPRGKPIYANIVSVAEDPVWDSYVQHVDGALIESFSSDWSDGYPSRDNWEEEMLQAEHALAQGKRLILVAQGEQDDAKLQEFAFASYLLIANGNAFFRYTNSDSYRELWMYENYSLDLGTPLGNRYQNKNEWRRDFTNGYVIVNPKNHKVEIVTTP